MKRLKVEAYIDRILWGCDLPWSATAGAAERLVSYLEEGRFLSFACNRENRSPAYDTRVVRDHPDWFFLAGEEVLALREVSPEVIPLERLKAIVQAHPTGALILFDETSRKDLSTDEVTPLRRLKRSVWSWPE